MTPAERIAGFLSQIDRDAYGRLVVYAWTAANTKAGKLKAVGTGEHQGQTLYGARAEAALRGRTPTTSESTGPKRQPAPDATRHNVEAVADRLLTHVRKLREPPPADAVLSAVSAAQQAIDAVAKQRRALSIELDATDHELFKLWNGPERHTDAGKARIAELSRHAEGITERMRVERQRHKELCGAAREAFAAAMNRHVKAPPRLAFVYGDSSQADAEPLTGAQPAQRQAINDAQGFLDRVCNWKGAPVYRLVRAKSGRAWCSNESGRIPAIAVGTAWDGAASTADDNAATGIPQAAEAAASVATTHVHELGHLIEFRKPGVRAKAQAFLAARRGAEPPVPLKQAIGDYGYADDEIGVKDRFDAAFTETAHYVGKLYPSGDTEIVSMGLERLYADPGTFAQADPDYFRFMVEVLLS